MSRIRGLVFLIALLVASSCTSSGSGDASSNTDAEGSASSQESEGSESDADDGSSGDGSSGDSSSGDAAVNQGFGEAPSVPTGDISEALRVDLDELSDALTSDQLDPGHVAAVASHGDARVAWFFSDLLRFIRSGPIGRSLIVGFDELTGVEVSEGNAWGEVTDHLLAWDIPAFDEYVTYKASVFTLVEPGWTPFFEDAGVGKDSAIDWRILSWGGVLIDNRDLGDPVGCARGCIPALDDPLTTSAADGDWYDDEAIVFGIVVNGEARAYQKNIMEVHEMVNDTLGGRRIGIPYCTLCGSAQAYFTDSVAEGIETPVLRTSGLLSRSNKVMYDLHSKSVFDTFTGQAVTGPLFDQGVVLEQVTVVTSTWGDWRAAHPDTTIVDRMGGIGRLYADDPLRGRDDDGPIFPVGDVDPRYEAHTPVIGVLKDDGTPVAFVVSAAQEATEAGEVVEFDGVTLVADGGGFRATDEAGNDLTAHQAFWFAWRQFYEEGEIWEG